MLDVGWYVASSRDVVKIEHILFTLSCMPVDALKCMCGVSFLMVHMK